MTCFLWIIPAAECSKYSIFTTLENEYCTQLHANNPLYGQIAQKAFQTFHKLYKECEPATLLQQAAIQDLFLLSSVQQSIDRPQSKTLITPCEINDLLQKAQKLMLVLLYAQFFNNFIQHTEKLTEQLFPSLHYWEKEQFHDTLPTFRKHPVYWYHSPNHKKLVKQHVRILKETEQELTHLLGIALHGRHVLNKIQNDVDFSDNLYESFYPLYQHFNMLPRHEKLEPQTFLQDTIWINTNIHQKLAACKQKLEAHKKPHHIVEHGFLYSCIALTMIAAYVTYKTHENEMPEYQRKTAEAWNNFVKEYIKQPLQQLKNVLWDNKVPKIPQFGDLPAFPHWENDMMVEVTIQEKDALITVKPYGPATINIKDPIKLGQFNVQVNPKEPVQIPTTTITVQGDQNKSLEIPATAITVELQDLLKYFSNGQIEGTMIKGLIKAAYQMPNFEQSPIHVHVPATAIPLPLPLHVNIPATAIPLPQDTSIHINPSEHKISGFTFEMEGGEIKLPKNFNFKIPCNDVNKVWDTLNAIVKELAPTIKGGIDVGNETLRNQNLMLAIVAIAPALIIAYSGYRLTNHTYNKYIKHESWYRPMQLLMRDMDRILNKLTTTKDLSYADDGALHLLTLQLKKFVICLPNEELQLIEQDLAELAAYHLSYEQKRGVLERMYRTYEFLNN